MISITSASLIEAGSSAGLLVSTITHWSPGARSAITSGRSSPQRPSIHTASVFGVPCSTALAGVLRTSDRYHAQISGEPVESVSGALWPKTWIMKRSLVAQSAGL